MEGIGKIYSIGIACIMVLAKVEKIIPTIKLATIKVLRQDKAIVILP